jgi:hypothetical protein
VISGRPGLGLTVSRPVGDVASARPSIEPGRSTHGEIIIRFEGNDAICYSDFIEVMGGTGLTMV